MKSLPHDEQKVAPHDPKPEVTTVEEPQEASGVDEKLTDETPKQ